MESISSPCAAFADSAGEELAIPTPYRQIRADFTAFAEDLGDDPELEFERAPFIVLLRRYLDSRSLGVEWEVVNAAPAPALINSLSMALPFEPVEKQALLEAPGLEERRTMLTALMAIDAAAPAPTAEDDDDAPPLLQ